MNFGNKENDSIVLSKIKRRFAQDLRRGGDLQLVRHQWLDGFTFGINYENILLKFFLMNIYN